MIETNSQRVAKNSGYLFIRMILVLLVTLYTSRVVLSALGFEDFGIFDVVGSVVVFLSFFQAALNTATYRYIAFALGKGDSNKLREVYSMAINCHILLAIVLLIVMELGGIWFINNKLVIPQNRMVAANWLYQFSLLTFCLNIIRTPFNSNIIAHEKMNFFALVSVVEVVLTLGVAIGILHSTYDKLITYGVLLTIVAVIILVCYFLYCKIIIKDTIYIRCWKGDIVKQYSTYAGWSLLVNAADVSTFQCISIFFNIFIGVIANAALGVTNQVIGAFNHFLNSFSQAFNPQIIKQYAAGRKESFMRMVFATSKISFYFVLVISLPIIINIDYVLSLWLGKYPPYAPIFIQATILYTLVDALQLPLVQAVHATGNIRFHQQIVSVIKFLAIPLMYISLYVGFSGVFVLLIRFFSNLICAIFRVLYMRKLIHLDLGLYIKDVIARAVITVLIILPLPLVVRYYLSSSMVSLLLSISLTIILSLLIGITIGFNKQERQLIFSLPYINKITHKR